jgi:hypothetical protein
MEVERILWKMYMIIEFGVDHVGFKEQFYKIDLYIVWLYVNLITIGSAE